MKDDALLERVEADWRAAGLDARRVAMLEYALKLSATPSAVVRADVETLREHGLSDTDVLHLAELVGYYAYVNRIADGLGVELEGEGEA